MNKISKINFAKKQLAAKWKCDYSVFEQDKNIFIQSSDSFFEMVTFGKNAVIKVDPLIHNWCLEHFSSISAHDIMDGENLYNIETKLREFGRKLAGEHVRYIYLNNGKTVAKPCNYDYKLFDKKDMKELYVNKNFENALNYCNDVIALGAYKGNQLVALAGADDSLSSLWQIGIDTLFEYRNNGLASYLVKTLADEIEKRGQLPYYTTWSPNLASTAVALNAGFFPAWVGYYAERI